MKHIILAATAALISATLPASADSDHDRALQALRSGEVLSLRTILDKAATDFPGDLIEAELEHEDDRTIYEIKLLTPEGQVLKLEYDARTGVLLKTKEKKPR
ncbi:MAG: PepSY domain-containing protein [Rhodospirillaceae bacterium]